jgi:hypothetical protein
MKIKFNRADAIFLVVFISFFWLRLFEHYLIGPLGAYKQIIILGLTVYCLYTCKSPRALRISIYCLAIMGILALWSYFVKGMPIPAIAYNSFNYISWIPFFLFGVSRRGVIPLECHWHKLFAILYVSSIIGLILDYHLDIASHVNPSIIDWREYARYSGDDVSRSEFFFGGSVKVIPQLIFICFLVISTGILANKWTMNQSLLVSLPLMLVFPYTHTTNAFLFSLLFILSVCFCIQSELSKSLIFLALSYLTISLLIFIAPSLQDLDGTRFARPLAQIGVVQSSRFSDQDGRISFWMESVTFLDSAPLLNVLLGDGIGTGGGQFSQGITGRSHGESSFIQSLFEGGILATILRLLPFYIGISAYFRLHSRYKVSAFHLSKRDGSLLNLCVSTILLLFMICAVAPLMVYLPVHMYVGWISGRLFRLAAFSS